MLRHVLVCLEPAATNEGCRRAALDLGRMSGCALTGIYVRSLTPAPVPVIYPMAGLVVGEGMVPAGVLAEMDERVLQHEAEENRRQQEVFDAFLSEARERGVRAGTMVRTGEVQEEIIAASRGTDLVMLGRGRAGSESLLGSAAGAVVRSVRRPVMMVPRWDGPPGRIAVAYDGSPGADRALAMAVDIALASRPRDVEIVLIGITAQESEPSTFLEPARRYVNASELTHRVCTAPGDPAVLIEALARTEDAGLLAMGAYGHSLIREVLLGSTTQALLAAWDRPLLLSH